MSANALATVPSAPLATAEPRAARLTRLEIPAGAAVERLHCALCGALVAAAIIPPSPPLPFEFKTLLRPIARYVARKSPELQRAAECLLEGNLGGMIQAMRESAEIAALVPVVCPRCIADERFLVAGTHVE